MNMLLQIYKMKVISVENTDQINKILNSKKNNNNLINFYPTFIAEGPESHHAGVLCVSLPSVSQLVLREHWPLSWSMEESCSSDLLSFPMLLQGDRRGESPP